MAKQWTSQEVEIMRANYSKITGKEMEGLLPGRKKASIHKKAEQLGLRGYIVSEWSQEDIVSLVQSYKKYTINEIVARGLCSGRSKTAIKGKVLSLGLEKRTVWTKQEEQILVDNYLNRPVKEIQEFLPEKDYWTITSHARVMGLKKHPSSYRRRYGYNRNFFSVPIIDNSYFAGFIAADGSVDKERGTVRIGIQQKDILILSCLADLILFTGDISIGVQKTSKGIFKFCKIEFSSAQQMVKDLENNFNIVQNKTFILEPPIKLNYENSLAFIAGLIDGDGSIVIPSNSDKWGHLYPVISITGTRNLLEWVKTIFDNICPSIYGINARVLPIKNCKSFSYKVGGNRAYHILKELQKVNTPTRLVRKWDKIAEYEALAGLG
jgi:hypothetical protein